MCDSLKVGQFVDTTSPGFAPGVSVNIVKGRLAGESGTVVKLSGSGSRCHLTLNPGGQEVLLPVTSLDVASPEPVPAVSGRPFMKGEMVRVVSGHFEGLSGTIAAIDIPGVLYQVDLPGYSAPALVGHGKLQSAESEALSA
jgi:transcription antitermination factor NusG